MEGKREHSLNVHDLVSAGNRSNINTIIFSREVLTQENCIKRICVVASPNFKKEYGPKAKKPVLEDFIVTWNDNLSTANPCPLYRRYGIEHFMVVHFDTVVPQNIINDILKSGLWVDIKYKKQRKLSAERYIFFGHSPSNLRERTCVLYREHLEPCHEDITRHFGDFEVIKTVSKRAARIGLLLSTAKGVVEIDEDEVFEEEDIERNSFNFTDGCGSMSLKVALELTEKLGEKVGKCNVLKSVETSPFGLWHAFEVWHLCY